MVFPHDLDLREAEGVQPWLEKCMVGISRVGRSGLILYIHSCVLAPFLHGGRKNPPPNFDLAKWLVYPGLVRGWGLGWGSSDDHPSVKGEAS